jgi:predicted secreted hydrolase
METTMLIQTRLAALLMAVAALLGLIGCNPAAGPTPAPTPLPSPTPTVAAASSSPIPAPTPQPVTFPEDEAPHQNMVEWWYYNGHLQDGQGQEYGFHFVIFQFRSPEGAVGYMAHTSVTDVEAGAHEQAFQISAQAQPQPDQGFSFDIQGWRLNGTLDQHSLAAQAPGYAMDLTLDPVKPPVPHDEDGFLIGPEGWTYYYSWTRMDVQGTLTLDGQPFQVTGQGWMDHQWGDFRVSGYPAGWQWFAVQLADGTDLMAYEFRADTGETAMFGTLVAPDGGVTYLKGDDLSLRVLEHWTSPHTQAEYPAGWTLTVEDADLELEVLPIVPDQEVTVAFPPNTIYWEGKSSITGFRNGEPVEGQAYVELVGYVQAPMLLPSTPTSAR